MARTLGKFLKLSSIEYQVSNTKCFQASVGKISILLLEISHFALPKYQVFGWNLLPVRFQSISGMRKQFKLFRILLTNGKKCCLFFCEINNVVVNIYTDKLALKPSR